jgi:Terpene synthase family 2, C-terminal metal binding
MSDEMNPCPGIAPETRVHLPALSQRFTCGLHPQYYDILRRHEEWVHDHLLPSNPPLASQILRDNLSALFVCMAYYRLDAEKVLDICDLTDWLFIHDSDVARLRTAPGTSDDVRQASVQDYLGRLRGMLKGGPAPEEPWAMESIYDLIPRFRAKSSPALFRRLVDAFGYYSTITIGSEASDLLNQRITDLTGYMQMRAIRGSSATLFFHVITEYVLGVDLDPKIVSSEPVSQYWRSIMDYWYLPNDLLSFRTECTRGDHNNAVCLLRRFEGLSLQQAVNKVAELIDDRQEQAAGQYADICTSPLGSDPDLLACLKTFQHIGAANHRWSFMAPRYHGKSFVWNGVLTGELRLTPDHTYFPDVPATM